EGGVGPPGAAGRGPGGGGAVHPHQRGGGEPAEQPGGDPGGLDREAGAAGCGGADEERDDDGGGDDRAQQPRAADLAGRAEVAGQHGGQDGAVDDHGFGELGN